eukprot:1769280-Amphidinium_carterae.1
MRACGQKDVGMRAVVQLVGTAILSSTLAVLACLSSRPWGCVATASEISLFGGKDMNGTAPCSRRDDSCTWRFLQYIPSELEEKWQEIVDRVGSTPCE